MKSCECNHNDLGDCQWRLRYEAIGKMQRWGLLATWRAGVGVGIAVAGFRQTAKDLRAMAANLKAKTK